MSDFKKFVHGLGSVERVWVGVDAAQCRRRSERRRCTSSDARVEPHFRCFVSGLPRSERGRRSRDRPYRTREGFPCRAPTPALRGVMLTCSATLSSLLWQPWSGSAACALAGRDLDGMGDGPQEADHLAGDGSDGEGALFAGGKKVAEACGEPRLGLGGDLTDRFRQALAALPEGKAGARLGEIGPGRLGEDAANPG